MKMAVTASASRLPEGIDLSQELPLDFRVAGQREDGVGQRHRCRFVAGQDEGLHDD